MYKSPLHLCAYYCIQQGKHPCSVPTQTTCLQQKHLLHFVAIGMVLISIVLHSVALSRVCTCRGTLIGVRAVVKALRLSPWPTVSTNLVAKQRKVMLNWNMLSAKSTLSICLFCYLKVEEMFRAMTDIFIKSLHSVQEIMINDKHCFELYGYDILIGEDLKPYVELKMLCQIFGRFYHNILI